MGKSAILLAILLLIVIPVPVIAFQCFSENDCPKCSIDGATVTKKSLDTGYTDKQILTCEYSSTNENVGKVALRITCFENAGIARQVTDYYAGTGENPNKSQYAGLYSRPRWVCVSGGSTKGAGQTMIKTFGCGDFTGTDRFVATIDADGQATYLSSDPASEESRKFSAAKDVVKARIQKYKDCFAGFSPGATPSPQEMTLHGTVIATKVYYGIVYPLKHAKLALYEVSKGKERRLLGETTTDGEGAYEFKETFEKGKTYDIEIELTYSDKKDYFSVYLGSAESVSNKVLLLNTFTYIDDNDLEQDIDLDTLWTTGGFPGDNPFGFIYVHTAEALEFYKDKLHEDIHLNLPLKIIAYVPNIGFQKDMVAMYYIDSGSGNSAIAIREDESGAESEYRPINREYHEFSHYMMTNTYGRYLDSRVKSDIAIVNHDGYVNPSTSDSWQEGFAAFMSVLIAQNYGYSCNGNTGSGSINQKFQAWDFEGKAEELAVAGVLYDLYDGEAESDTCENARTIFVGKLANSPYLNQTRREMAFLSFLIATKDPGNSERLLKQEIFQDSDNISLSVEEIWAVLRNKHPDFTSVYQGFVERYPGKKAQIDAVFEKHGFFIDKNRGNGKYDPGEPFRDANGNSVYDTGEYFTDLSLNGNGMNIPEFDKITETVGTATNYERPWRLSTVKLPGHFVKVNNAVPFYGYVVEFPGTLSPAYSAFARNNDGLIYVQVPPETGAKITVTPIGVTTSNPLVFTSDHFNENYMTAVKQGYYTSYDFKISGPIPTPPVTPNFGKGGLTGKKSSGFPDLLSPTSRIPLIISVPIIIAALLVLVYVLRKER